MVQRANNGVKARVIENANQKPIGYNDADRILNRGDGMAGKMTGEGGLTPAGGELSPFEKKGKIVDNSKQKGVYFNPDGVENRPAKEKHNGGVGDIGDAHTWSVESGDR